METLTVRRHKERLDEVKQDRTEEVDVCEGTFHENTVGLNSNAKATNADNVKMFVERKLILVHFGEHVCALQALVIENVEPKLTLTNAKLQIKELLKCVLSIYCSDYSVSISKLMRDVQQLSGLVESMNLDLQTMPGLVDEASRLWEDLAKLNRVKDCPTAVNKIMLALETGISELKTTTCSGVSSLQEVKPRASNSKRGLENAQVVYSIFAFSGDDVDG